MIYHEYNIQFDDVLTRCVIPWCLCFHQGESGHVLLPRLLPKFERLLGSWTRRVSRVAGCVHRSEVGGAVREWSNVEVS